MNIGVQPGEYFFGVNDVTFEKTAFFRQLFVPSGKDEYIAEQLQNISMSADEQISTKKALKRLTDAKNMLSGRLKNGLIPKLESEQYELEQKLTDAFETNRMIQELSDKITEYRRMISENARILEKLNSESENIDKYESILRLKQLMELERNEARAQLEYIEAKKLLKKEQLPENSVITSMLSLNAEYKSELRNKERIYADITKEEEDLRNLQSDSGENNENVKAFQKKAKKQRTFAIVLMIIGFLMCVSGVAFYLMEKNVLFLIIALSVGLLLFAISFVSVVMLRKKLKSKGYESLKDLEAIIKSYPLFEQRVNDKKNKITSLNNAYTGLVNRLDEQKKNIENAISEYIFLDKSKSYEEQIDFISDAVQKVVQKREAYKTHSATREKATENIDMDALSAQAQGAVKPEREKVKVDNEINFYSQQMKIFEEKERESERQKALLEGRGSDPAVLTGKRDAVKSKLLEYRKKYAALETAVEKLTEASEYMKSTVAPRINAYAGEFFSSATKGKYTALSVDTAMAMSFKDDTGIKSCDYLSAGTRDSAYLCLRFALIKLLYNGVNPPIILDDAFGRFDDERLEALLGLLSAKSTEGQIFIFTCGDRERNLLDKAGINYSALSL
ncbi:MAG TPA: hypothetical protein DD733_11795 [Clostridiales bacterium]|nr:hypothetical protein [Clostridiales bacterium]